MEISMKCPYTYQKLGVQECTGVYVVLHTPGYPQILVRIQTYTMSSKGHNLFQAGFRFTMLNLETQNKNRCQ